MAHRIALATLAVLLALPLSASAETIPIEPPPPCTFWHCGGDAEIVVEEYRVDTLVEDGIAATRVRQVIRNESDFVAEGTFLHPIPHDAAVTGLTLWIDGEPVSGELLDGDVARRTYEEIVRRTLDPALLEWADDGLLQLSVFPIEPHGTRTVEIEYRQVLPVDGGLFRFRHPMGSEHNAHIEQVSARIVVRSDDGVKNVYSPTPGAAISRPDANSAVIGFEKDTAPEGELVLYHSTDADPIALDVLTYRDGDDGYFVLLASPGLDENAAIVPKDVVLVVDVSGSMEGEKISQARSAARYVLSNLNTNDRFDVIAFSTDAESFGNGLRPASEATDARVWVNGLSAGGSTNIDLALSQALDRATGERPTYVLFLTDGLATEGVTDTGEILRRLEERSRPVTSVFAFGVGYDVDTFLLDSIARDHHGSTTYVTPSESVDGPVEALYTKVAAPVLTDISLSVDGVVVTALHPHPTPDVFRGGQLVLTGRYTGSGEATVTLTGLVAGEEHQLVFDGVDFRDDDGGDPAVPRLWATRTIGDLLRSVRINGPDEETIDQIVRISIRWGVVTPYTSYLVTEDAPFGDDAVEEISEEAAREAAASTAPSSGEDAFSAADTASELSSSEQAFEPDAEVNELVRLAGDRTFLLVDGVWIDTTFDPAMETIDLAFGSEDYFSLASSTPAIAAALAVDASVLVVSDGIAYRITADETPPPRGTGSDTVPKGDVEDASDTPMATGSSAGDAGMDFPIAIVVIGAALGTALMLSWTALRRS